MWDKIASVDQTVNDVVWGIPALAMILGAGLILTLALRGMQFRKFGHVMRNTAGRVFSKAEAKNGEITPLQAVSTALAGTVGTGNIAGVTAAVTLGGAGAIFWMWISALIGMATKYAEVVLAIRFRERNENGEWVGGPMYYIKNGLGKRWKWLGSLFCLFGSLAAFGIGNAVQAGTIVDSVNHALQAFFPAAAAKEESLNWILGILLALIVAGVLFGGVKRIGSVASNLVPVMAFLYIGACVAVIAAHVDQLGRVFAEIFRGAFTPAGVTGGALGISMKTCAVWGIRRGVFSNEAGLGSAPIAHAASSETNPVRQGFYGIFEVFIDTIVICTLSGLTILLALDRAELHYGVQGTIALNAKALGTVFGDRMAALIIAAALALIALTSILGWGLYGCRCWEFLFGAKAVRFYQMVFIVVIVVGATTKLELVWSIADTFNGLMMLPNLLSVMLLSPVVIQLTEAYFARERLPRS